MPIEHYSWEENGENGSQLLEENGPRFGFGLDYRYRALTGEMPLRFRGEFVYGDVDYDGHTQDSDKVKLFTAGCCNVLNLLLT